MPRVAASLLCAAVAFAALAAPAPVYRPDPDPTRWFGLGGWKRPGRLSGHSPWGKTGTSTTVTVPAVKKKNVIYILSIRRDVEGDFRMQVRVRGDFRKGCNSAGLFLSWGKNAEPWYKNAELSVGLGAKNPGTEFLTEGRLPDNSSWTCRWEAAPSGKGDYVRLERRGGELIAAVSADGSTWVRFPDVKLPQQPRIPRNPPRTLTVGVFAKADGGTGIEAVFDEFELRPPK
jgi:regulation of enolase protein 1 (concanavalin A-like superfamily)